MPTALLSEAKCLLLLTHQVRMTNELLRSLLDPGSLDHLHGICHFTGGIPFAATLPLKRNWSCTPRKVHCKDPPQRPNVSIRPGCSCPLSPLYCGNAAELHPPSARTRSCPAPGHAPLPALPFRASAAQATHSTALSLVQTLGTEKRGIK